jgi:hypothetical protein
MMAADVTVNRSTISEMVSHGTGQQEHDHELPSRPRPAGTQGRLFCGPASSAYRCSSRSLPSLC